MLVKLPIFGFLVVKSAICYIREFCGHITSWWKPSMCFLAGFCEVVCVGQFFWTGNNLIDFKQVKAILQVMLYVL